MKNKKSTYTCHSLKEYNIVMNLRRTRNLGECRIQRELHKGGYEVKKGTIAGWIRGGKKPFNSIILTQIPVSSFALSKEKAYILGALCGDGFITTGYRVGLGVTDKDFAEYFKYCLNEVFQIPVSVRLIPRRKTNFCSMSKVRHSVVLVSKLVALDLFSYASSFKTFEWKVPNAIQQASITIKASFLRGFADSEGSVKNRPRNRELYLCSGNHFALKQIKNLLTNSFGIKAAMSKRKNNVYILRTSDYLSLNKFYKEIGFTIERKQKKLKAGLARYKRKGIRQYSLGFKELALDMLQNNYNHQEVGRLLNTSHANVHDWQKASKNSNYYKQRYQIWKSKQ
jgi:DNA endonuclease